jgi:hypothetical protein
MQAKLAADTSFLAGPSTVRAQLGSAGAQALAELRAHEPVAWFDANPGQVQPISIPTGADRWVRAHLPVGMPFAGMLQEFKAVIVQVEQLAPQDKGILSGKFPVVQFKGVILTAGVVEGGE